MKVLLIGNFGSGNIGDELILASSLRDYPNAVVMTADPAFSKKFCGRRMETVPFPPTGVRSALRFLFSGKYRKEFSSLKGVGKVVFPGGGLFAIKFKACWIWKHVFQWAKRFQCPIELLHQGVDEHLGFFSRLNTKFVLSHADKVTVRDVGSVRAVKSICGKNVENEQDKLQSLIFNLQLKEETESGLKFKSPDSRNDGRERIVLINARTKFSLEKLEGKFQDFRKIFVAFDRSDLKSVPESFKGEVVYPQTEREVFELFEKAKYAVGERFHFLLLGTHFCGTDHTFTLREPYAEKVKSFCSAFHILPLDGGGLRRG